VITLQKCV